MTGNLTAKDTACRGMPEGVVIVFLLLSMMTVLCFGAFEASLPFLCADWGLLHLFGAIYVTGRFLGESFAGFQPATMLLLELKRLASVSWAQPLWPLVG